jgi:hypothetical protein
MGTKNHGYEDDLDMHESDKTEGGFANGYKAIVSKAPAPGRQVRMKHMQKAHSVAKPPKEKMSYGPGSISEQAKSNLEAAGYESPDAPGSKFVTGPKGGARTTTGISEGPPKTRGPRTVGDVIGYVTGAQFKKPKRKPAKPAQEAPKSATEKGIEAIHKSGQRGTQLEGMTLGEQAQKD